VSGEDKPKLGCRDCLAEACRRDGTPMGKVRGFIAEEQDGLVVWRPCYGCNRERWSAWTTGELDHEAELPEGAGCPPRAEHRRAWVAALTPRPPVLAENESLEDRARRRVLLERFERWAGEHSDAEPDR
jgi:hypothetical protein